MPIPLEMTADLPAFQKELDMEVMNVATEHGYSVDNSEAAILAVAVTFGILGPIYTIYHCYMYWLAWRVAILMVGTSAASLFELRRIIRHRRPSFGEALLFHTVRKQDFPSLRFSSLTQNSSHYLLSVHVTKGGGVLTSFSHSLAHVWACISNFICFMRGVIAVFFPEVQAGIKLSDPNEGLVGQRIKAYTDMSVSVRRIWDCKNMYHRVAFPQDVRKLVEEMETAVRRAQRQRGIDFADVE